LRVAEDVEADPHLGDALERRDVGGDGLLKVVADRAAGGGERDDDLDLAVLEDLDRADHAELDDVAPQLRVDDLAEGLGDLLVGRKSHAHSLTTRSEKKIDRPLWPVDREERLLFCPPGWTASPGARQPQAAPRAKRTTRGPEPARR